MEIGDILFFCTTFLIDTYLVIVYLFLFCYVNYFKLKTVEKQGNSDTFFHNIMPICSKYSHSVDNQKKEEYIEVNSKFSDFFSDFRTDDPPAKTIGWSKQYDRLPLCKGDITSVIFYLCLFYVSIE